MLNSEVWSVCVLKRVAELSSRKPRIEGWGLQGLLGQATARITYKVLSRGQAETKWCASLWALFPHSTYNHGQTPQSHSFSSLFTHTSFRRRLGPHPPTPRPQAESPPGFLSY
jgi:hypothetical protein